MPWLTAAVLLSAASCAKSSSTLETCDDGLVPCGGTCVDANNDPENCGACGVACPSGQACEAGVCSGDGGSGGAGGGGDRCGEDELLCGGSCVDPQTNPQHCGNCETACPPGRTCTDGACGCPMGLSECGETCVNLQSDPLYCGSCEVQCGAGQSCTDGACVCNEGLTDCDGVCYDLQRNSLHCGACDVACDPGSYCREGACSCLVGPIEDISGEVPQTVNGTTVGGEANYGLTCVAAGSTEKVYRFTAEEAGSYTFDTAGSSYDTAIGVRSGEDCVELACNDDGLGAQSRAIVVLEAGETVLVVVSGFNGAQGDFALNIARAAPPICPSGDITGPPPQTVVGDTGPLGDAIAPSCGSSGSPDASYTWVVPATGRYIFDTAGSEFNTILELRNGGCDGAVIACNDDTMGQTSRITVDLSAGQTVVAVVDGFAGAAGPFTLNVTEYTPPPCPEIDLGGTVPQTVTGSTTGRDNVLEAPCGASGGREVTYSFTAPADALYVFDTFGSAFDTVLHIRDATCTGPSLGCNDDTSGLQSQVRLPLRAGQTVVVVVDGYGSATGNYTLNITQIIVPPCPAADLGSTVPQTVTGTTAGLADVLTPSCGGTGSPETSFSFTAPETGTYLFDTFGSSFDTVLHVHDGSCSGTTLGCNNDTGGAQSQVNVDLVAGQTIVVVVDGNRSTSGDFVLSVQRFLGGGTCAAPIDLGSTVPQTATGTTVGQLNSTLPTCGFSNAPDTVYSFTAPTDGTYIFDTFGSAFNTVLHVRNGNCTGATLACNDDAGSAQSRLNVDLVAGQTVYVVVDGQSTNVGDFILNVNQFLGGGTCSVPIDLGSTVPQTATGSTLLQPNSVTPSCSSGSAPDTIYTFTAPNNGTFIFDTLGSTYDTVIHVRDGSCTGASLACNDNAGGSQSRASAVLTAGQLVYVAVDGAGAAAGDFVLNVSEFSGAGTCGTPIDLGSTVPQTTTGDTSLMINAFTPACAFSNAPELIYTFTAPTTGNYVIDTAGSVFDTVLNVRDGSCSGTSLACNDDAVGLQSRVTVALTAGQVITIAVDGYSSASGAITLNINPG